MDPLGGQRRRHAGRRTGFRQAAQIAHARAHVLDPTAGAPGPDEGVPARGVLVGVPRLLLGVVAAPGTPGRLGGLRGEQRPPAVPVRAAAVLRRRDGAAAHLRPGRRGAPAADRVRGDPGTVGALAGRPYHSDRDAAPGLPESLRRMAVRRGPEPGDPGLVRGQRRARVLPPRCRVLPSRGLAPPHPVQGGQPRTLLRPLGLQRLRRGRPARRRPRAPSPLPGGSGPAVRRSGRRLRRRPQRVRRQRPHLVVGTRTAAPRGDLPRADATGSLRRSGTAVHRLPLRRTDPRPPGHRRARPRAGRGLRDDVPAELGRLARGVRQSTRRHTATAPSPSPPW